MLVKKIRKREREIPQREGREGRGGREKAESQGEKERERHIERYRGAMVKFLKVSEK